MFFGGTPLIGDLEPCLGKTQQNIHVSEFHVQDKYKFLDVSYYIIDGKGGIPTESFFPISRGGGY